MATQPRPSLPSPPRWPLRVRSAAVHAIALARMVLTTARGGQKSGNSLDLRIARLTEEILLLEEELRLKDARMGRIPAQRRPHYLPTERLAILELRAAHGWSQAQTADRLLITPATIASWMGRLDEEGPALRSRRQVREHLGGRASHSNDETEAIRCVLVPLERRSFRREVSLLVEWYSGHRPHSALQAASPNEIYFSQIPRSQAPRYEPRRRWPRGSPCARPPAPVRGRSGQRLALVVTHLGGRKYLPIVELKKAA